MAELLQEWDRLAVAGRLDLGPTTLHAGITALIGPSGCGKSTLLQLLSGFLRNPYALPACDWMPQDFGLWPGCTVQQHLEASAGKNKEPVRQWIHLLDLDDAAGKRAERCSVGEQARCALGRALCGPSPVLLLDEPLAHVDAECKHRYWKLILEHCSNTSRSLVYASHNPEQVLSAGGELIWLQATGQSGWNGAVDRFYKSPPSKTAMLQMGPGLWVDPELQQRLQLSRSGVFRPEALQLTANDSGSWILESSESAGRDIRILLRHRSDEALLEIPLLNTAIPEQGTTVTLQEVGA